ncbi:MAG: glycosyltransferase family 39 protein [Candidatus Daviesbacteria bacterium]|nr:glycosyltransferase family 39 protein [Candidatus Daviesbacteria bacterium]
MGRLLTVLKNQYFWLALILILGFAARLYKIDAPIADWHSWRQADTASVTRNFIKEGFNPFLPKYDDMSGVAERPIPNPDRFRFVEFPVYNILVYPFYLLFGVSDFFSRLVSALVSLGSGVFLFLIVRKFQGKFLGLLSTAIFTFLPFNIFFSRTTLPEPTLIFFSLGMIYFWIRLIEDNQFKWWAIFFTVVAFLIKPWAIFFFLPLIYLILRKSRRTQLKFLGLFLLCVTPFILWRLWILQQPEGIPASNWLINGDSIRFRPAFWWWIVQNRLGGEILGVTGFFLFFFGLLRRPINGNYFFHFWALSMFLNISIFASGNVRHNYYQVVLVPILAIFVAAGVNFLFNRSNETIPRLFTIPLSLFFLGLTFYLTWMPVKEFYKINNPPIIQAGKVADQILPKDALVVAPYNGDTAFLYQTNRAGFAASVLPVADLVTEYGIHYYISTSKDNKTNWIIRHFTVLKNEPEFVIADLTKIQHPLTKEDPEP